MQVLLDAGWRPATPGMFPDRPSSPARVSAASSAASSSGAAAAPAAAKGYVPPHLRDQPGEAADAAEGPILHEHDPIVGTLPSFMERIAIRTSISVRQMFLVIVEGFKSCS